VSSGISFPDHKITCVIQDTQIKGWIDYEIHSSMIEPASRFAMNIPFDLAVWGLTVPDAAIQILIDDVEVLTGFIDEHLMPEGDDVIRIVGRNRYGRMVDESAPTINYANLTMFELVTQVASPWYTNVVFTNARNRRVTRGRGKKARAGDEPVVLFARKAIGTRINPGMSRHQVIEDLCAQSGCLVFPSGDGSELIIGQPNYEQEPQFYFFMPQADSTRVDQSTVLAMGISESVAERYSRVIVVGSGTGTDANYGATVASRYAQSFNDPLTADGTGLDFRQRKCLIAVRPVNSIAEAQELADREMARRDMSRRKITVRSQGHGQVIAGVYTTIFAPDLLALVEDERTMTKGTYIVTDCTFHGNREGAEETSLTLLPKGAVLIS
jgi:prophage tail gpP-like protein